MLYWFICILLYFYVSVSRFGLCELSLCVSARFSYNDRGKKLKHWIFSASLLLLFYFLFIWVKFSICKALLQPENLSFKHTCLFVSLPSLYYSDFTSTLWWCMMVCALMDRWMHEWPDSPWSLYQTVEHSSPPVSAPVWTGCVPLQRPVHLV